MNLSGEGLMLKGLTIAVIGMAWVFAGLGLVWGLIFLLDRIFPHTIKAPSQKPESGGCEGIPASTEAPAADSVTAERARVAAIVATALLSGALPLHREAPVGSVFEHGRTAPNWVTANRARTLHPWQPSRRSDG
jgi:Na+-transporting methylmalonyl-CoA/oxaloacetate decarboxylase gamma subunit